MYWNHSWFCHVATILCPPLAHSNCPLVYVGWWSYIVKQKVHFWYLESRNKNLIFGVACKKNAFSKVLYHKVLLTPMKWNEIYIQQKIPVWQLYGWWNDRLLMNEIQISSNYMFVLLLSVPCNHHHISHPTRVCNYTCFTTQQPSNQQPCI